MTQLALNIIEKVFLDKKDKAGKPYIDHLKRVAENACAIAPYGFVDKIEIVALLHDLIEDCPEWTIEHIEAIFNDSEITNALALLTRKRGDNYDEYVQRIGCSLISRIVKLADLKDNMDLTRLSDSLTDRDIERIKKYHRSYLYLDNIGRKVEYEIIKLL